MSTWLPVVTRIGGIVVGSGVTLVTGLCQAVITRRGQQDSTALDRSKSDRELIQLGLTMQNDPDPGTKRRGRALLDGLAQMPGLDPKDAVLLQQMTRPVIEETLSRARAVEGTPGGTVEFYETDDEGTE